MSAVPPSTLKPGDASEIPTYADVLQRWNETGQGEYVENLSAGWQYREIWPDTSQTQPVFVLVVSAVDTRPTDAEGFQGYARAMGTQQSSLPGGRRALPKEPV